MNGSFLQTGPHITLRISYGAYPSIQMGLKYLLNHCLVIEAAYVCEKEVLETLIVDNLNRFPKHNSFPALRRSKDYSKHLL